MEIPYYVFDIVFAAVLLLYFIFVFFSVYHMVRFGFFDFVAKLHTIMLLSVIVVILTFTAILLRNVHWTDTFSIFDQLGFEDIRL